MHDMDTAHARLRPLPRLPRRALHSQPLHQALAAARRQIKAPFTSVTPQYLLHRLPDLASAPSQRSPTQAHCVPRLYPLHRAPRFQDNASIAHPCETRRRALHSPCNSIRQCSSRTMQHTEASAGLLSLAARTSDAAEGWLVPVLSASASCSARLRGQCCWLASGLRVPSCWAAQLDLAATAAAPAAGPATWACAQPTANRPAPPRVTPPSPHPHLQAQDQTASRQERLSEQASLFMANLLAQAAPGTADWLCVEPAEPLAAFQQQAAAPPAATAQQQQRQLTSEEGEVQPIPRISLQGLRRPSATAAPQPRPASAVPRPASSTSWPASKPAALASSRPAQPAQPAAPQAASPRPLWRPSGTAQRSPVTPRHSTPGTPTRQSLAGSPTAARTATARAPAARQQAQQAQQRPASAAPRQAPRAEELSPSTKVAQWLFSPAHPAAPAGALSATRICRLCVSWTT